MTQPTPFAELPGTERVRRFEGKEHGSSVSFYLTRVGPGHRVGLHRHPYDETFIVEEGTALFTLDGETVKAHAGHIVVVPAGTAHGFTNAGDEELRQVSIHAAPVMVQEDLEE
jgi:quercetin dioxygenase-like cupin family protein